MERMLDTKQVCQRYGITPKTLVTWKKTLKLPYFDFGRIHRYNEGQLHAWERSYMVHADNPADTFIRHRPKSILSRSITLSSTGERDDR